MQRSLPGALFCLGAMMAADKPAEPTFYRDVLPVLQKNCQSCHRPGEAAPMAFMDYAGTRPWAKAIKQAVTTRKMPPWFADPHVGKFSNDRRMSDADIATLVNWADKGARKGDEKHAPKPAEWVEGWQIGKPDAVFEMPHEFEVPEGGTIEYQYIVLPTGLTEDRWVQMAESRPGNRAVVHHIIAFIREPGNTWMKDAKPGVPYVPPAGAEGRGRGGAGMADDNLTGFAPGMPADMLRPGQARLLKAGSDIVLQMHYTANGKKQRDRSRIGIVWAKQPPAQRVLTVAAGNNRFVIPPGAPDHKVDAQLTLPSRVELIGMLPHMHLRGKSFSYRAVYPDGTAEDLLHVPRYDFNWQLWYYPAGEKILPAGTRIECSARYDNSPNNPANPDPAKEVRFGEQSWEEMMFGFFDIAFDAKIEKKDLFRPQRNTTPKPSAE